jgi:hypothetical protein
MTKTSEKGPPGEHTLYDVRSTGTSEARNGRRNPESINRTVKKEEEEEKQEATRRERGEGGRV